MRFVFTKEFKLAVAFLALPGMALAQEPTALNDPNIGMIAQLGGDLDWQVQPAFEPGQSTVLAFSQEGDVLTLIQVLTMIEVNPAALGEPEQVEFTTKEFLEGLCGPYVCADTANSEYVAIGDRNAWVLETEVGLQDFKSMGLTEAVFAATTTPQGFMQLFSLHTVPGGSADLKDELLAAAASASFE